MWFFSKLLYVVSRLLQLKPYRWIELNVNSIRPIKSIIPSSTMDALKWHITSLRYQSKFWHNGSNNANFDNFLSNDLGISYCLLRDVTIVGPPRCPVWHHLYSTVYRRQRLENTQNGGNVLLIANLMADSESRSNNTSISLSTGDIRVWQTAYSNHYYSWPANKHCGGPANKQQWLPSQHVQRTGTNGESTSMVWPTLGSTTAKEQNRTDGYLS